jgi:hypothetical protein
MTENASFSEMYAMMLLMNDKINNKKSQKSVKCLKDKYELLSKGNHVIWAPICINNHYILVIIKFAFELNSPIQYIQVFDSYTRVSPVRNYVSVKEIQRKYQCQSHVNCTFFAIFGIC